MDFDWEKAGVAIGVIAAGLAVLGTLFGWFGKAWSWTAGLFRRGEPAPPGGMVVPKRTVILVPSMGRNSSWWHMGSISDQPAMQVSAKLNVTNISPYHVHLMGGLMRKPKAVGVVLVRAPDRSMFGDYEIPKGHISEAHVNFWIQPPAVKEGRSFTADIAVVDQFGNEHWLKGVEFRYM
ncbi:hypothetical protein ACRS57_03715 [Pseudomonas aeruginosa]|uniref:hypothetical protein n=1 Tax=Pseudomonas aeruginosa TaxID=287 RepID=UPI0032E40FB2